MSTDPRRGPIPEGRDTNFNLPTLESTVITIVSKHVEDFDATTVTVRESKGGKYLAVSVSFTARSKNQLDSIYTELTSHADIVWAL